MLSLASKVCLLRNKQTNLTFTSTYCPKCPNKKQTPHLMAHPPSHASCRSPHCPCPLPQRCAAGSPAPAAAARGKEAAVRRRHRIVPPSFIPSTAGLRYYPQLSHKMHFKLCVLLFVVAVALMCPFGLCYTGLVALPKCPTR